MKTKRKNINSQLARINQSSTGTQQDSAAHDTGGIDLMQMVNNDALLKATIEITASTMTKNGYHFMGKDYNKWLDKLNKLRFYRLMKIIVKHWLIYRNVFLELVRNNSGEVLKVEVIDPTTMEIVHDEFGNVKGYLQINPVIGDGGPQIIAIPKEKIIHLSKNHEKTDLWGHSEMNSLVRVAKSKALVEDYISWLFESNQFRAYIKIPFSVDEDSLDEYIDLLKNGMRNPKNFLVLYGEDAAIGVLREIDGFEQLLKLLDYYRSQMLALMQLPPLQVGILDSSNRSSSEYQVRYAFYTKVNDENLTLADELNHELFPALGMKGLTLCINALDERTQNDIMDIAQKMLLMGANRKKLNKWLIENGIDIPKDLLEEPEPMEQSGSVLDKNSSIHPSRKPSSMSFNKGLKETKGGE